VLPFFISTNVPLVFRAKKKKELTLQLTFFSQLCDSSFFICMYCYGNRFAPVHETMDDAGWKTSARLCPQHRESWVVLQDIGGIRQLARSTRSNRTDSFRQYPIRPTSRFQLCLRNRLVWCLPSPTVHRIIKR